MVGPVREEGKVTATGFDVIDAHQHYGSIYDSMGGLETAMPPMSAEEIERVELETRLESAR